MNASRLGHFKSLLEGERQRIVALLAAASAVPASLADSGPGEESIAGVGGAVLADDTALIARETAALADVERALQLMRDDPAGYGVCHECGQPIAGARLELVPTTRYCARHADVVP